jgi:ABC-type Mn2+/Zn2+ transport system ATPase subunit
MVILPYKSQCQHPTPQSQTAVECVGVSARYSKQKAWALQDITTTIVHGEHVGIIGGNGAGKSTFLKAIAGLLPTTHKRFQVFGKQAGFCQHRVTYLPQRSNIDWSFPVSVKTFILAGRYIYLGWLKRPGAEDHKLAKEVIDLLQLQHLQSRLIGDLSGGQQQRVLIARTLVHDAEMLLLDEPLNAIDTETQDIVLNILKTLKHNKKTVVMTAHEADPESHEFNQILYFQEGRLIKRDS